MKRRTVRNKPAREMVAVQVERRPVRLVTLFGRVPILPRGVKAERESSYRIDLPEYDRTVGKIPRGSHRLRLPLVIYRLVPSGQ